VAVGQNANNAVVGERQLCDIVCKGLSFRHVLAARDGLYLDLDGKMSSVGQDRSILEQGNIRRSDDITTAGDSDNEIMGFLLNLKPEG
jgi:hypothetical protein